MSGVRKIKALVLTFGLFFSFVSHGSANTDSLVVTDSGNVGIGTTDPATKLDVRGSAKIFNSSGRSLLIEREDEDSWLTFHDPGQYWYSMGIDRSDDGKLKINYGGAVGEYNHITMTSSGRVGIGTNSPSQKFHVDGNIYCTGSLQESDVRWKENIDPIENALDLVTQLRGVSYDWSDPSRGEDRQLGVIAQEVEAVLPELVHTDSQGYKSVEYAKLVAPLIEAVKELKEENEDLKTLLKQMNNRLAALEDSQ